MEFCTRFGPLTPEQSGPRLFPICWSPLVIEGRQSFHRDSNTYGNDDEPNPVLPSENLFLNICQKNTYKPLAMEHKSTPTSLSSGSRVKQALLVFYIMKNIHSPSFTGTSNSKSLPTLFYSTAYLCKYFSKSVIIQFCILFSCNAHRPEQTLKLLNHNALELPSS